MPRGRTTQGQLVSGISSPSTGPATASTVERGRTVVRLDDRHADRIVDGGEVGSAHIGKFDRGRAGVARGWRNAHWCRRCRRSAPEIAAPNPRPRLPSLLPSPCPDAAAQAAFSLTRCEVQGDLRRGAIGAIGISYSTASRISAFTSTSCGMGVKGSTKKISASIIPSATGGRWWKDDAGAAPQQPSWFDRRWLARMAAAGMPHRSGRAIGRGTCFFFSVAA